jgi:hypothetical protein
MNHEVPAGQEIEYWKWKGPWPFGTVVHHWSERHRGKLLQNLADVKIPENCSNFAIGN